MGLLYLYLYLSRDEISFHSDLSIPTRKFWEKCVNTGHYHFHVRPNLPSTIRLQPEELLLGNETSPTEQMTVNSPTLSKKKPRVHRLVHKSRGT